MRVLLREHELRRTSQKGTRGRIRAIGLNLAEMIRRPDCSLRIAEFPAALSSENRQNILSGISVIRT